MYTTAKTWNPFKGCEFDCSYCRPSFQQQSKRQMHLCDECYRYTPHTHPDRLGKAPSAEIVFVSGNGDLAFCPPEFVYEILNAIEKHNRRCAYKAYYLQSKRPECLAPFLNRLPPNVILVTTLETNRDEGYEKISKAPLPSVRYQQFKELDYSRKVVTMEPVMDLDLDVFPQWLLDLKLEYVWLGLNSRPGQVPLPEPPLDKLQGLVHVLDEVEVEVQLKKLRGMQVR